MYALYAARHVQITSIVPRSTERATDDSIAVGAVRSISAADTAAMQCCVPLFLVRAEMVRSGSIRETHAHRIEGLLWYRAPLCRVLDEISATLFRLLLDILYIDPRVARKFETRFLLVLQLRGGASDLRQCLARRQN